MKWCQEGPLCFLRKLGAGEQSVELGSRGVEPSVRPSLSQQPPAKHSCSSLGHPMHKLPGDMNKTDPLDSNKCELQSDLTQP